MCHYTYKLILNNGLFYIGVRSCKCLPAADQYFGSSKYFKREDVYHKIILGEFNTRELANENEIYLHNKYDVAASPWFANKSKRTSVGFCTQGTKPSKETRRKLSKAKLGKNNPNFGKTPSEETRRKLSKASSGKTPSEETRRKLSKAQSGENNPRFDSRLHYFYNVETKQLVADTYFGLRKNSQKLLGLGPRSVGALKRGERRQVKNWVYLRTEISDQLFSLTFESITF